MLVSMGVLAGLLILSFYCVLGGMVTRYMTGYLMQLLGLDGFAGQGANFLNYLLYDYGSMLFFFFVFMAVTMTMLWNSWKSTGSLQLHCRLPITKTR